MSMKPGLKKLFECVEYNIKEKMEHLKLDNIPNDIIIPI